MTIPDYETIMLPLLRFAGDGEEHTVREAFEAMSDVFELSEEERRQLLPSGRQPVIENRVGWAKTYMTKAGLLGRSRRGIFKITQPGLDVLSQDPPTVNQAFLERFPAFLEFKRLRKLEQGADESTTGAEQTPQELLENGYQQIRSELADELLTTVMQTSPAFFERLVVELLVRMGYGGSLKDAGEAVGRSGDGGIDGIIKEDKLGLDAIYIQAKRWTGSVGSNEVRAFVGGLAGRNATKGVFITTSTFTRDAVDFVKNLQQKVILIDGTRLADLMIDYSVGVSTVTTYDVKKVDADYFVEE
jgi:restriction system protein